MRLLIAIGYVEQYTCSVSVTYLDANNARECFEVIRDYHNLPDETIEVVLVVKNNMVEHQYTAEHWSQ